MYLNHGYHFFAPEPTESTLLSFQAERPDGTVVNGQHPRPRKTFLASCITAISC